MVLFYSFILLIILQRISELVIAKRNEQWMKKRGAKEFGQRHYRLIVFIHTLFFVVFYLEVKLGERELSPAWHVLLILFALTQWIRIWAITALGKFWNTKIIVLPGAALINKGPYRFMKHPNYLVVSLEFLIIPMLFHAYLTAGLFTLLNLMILTIRIPAEEKALKSISDYDGVFQK